MPEDWEKSPWTKIAVIVGGVGSSAFLTEQLKAYLPEAVTPEIAGVGVGVLAYLYGDRLHPLVKYLGIGLIAGSLEPRIADMITEATAKTAGGSSGHSSNPGPLKQSYLARLR